MSSKAISSAATSGKDPPQNKKTKLSSPATEPTPISISSLPDDLLLNCLARVSRLHYHILSRVSKRFRSIIASPELYATRSRLNRTEKCLYLYLHFRRDPEAYLFTLTRLPSRNVANESSGYSVEKIPCPNSLLHAESSTIVAVGSDIYKIGGGDNSKCEFWKRYYSSSVSVLDCRTHTWRQAPSMGVERDSTSTATLFDGKICVGGGCDDKYVSTPRFMEVFDLETQTWGFGLRNPCVFRWSEEYRVKPFVKSFVLEGKLYIFGDNGSVYNPEDNRWWDLGYDNVRMPWVARECHCVIDDVLYCWDKTGVFKWYDFKTDLLKEVNGIEGLPDLREKCKKAMVDLGGKMGFLWNEDLDNGECKIWCAEIKLEKRSADEIWGKVEWFGSLLRTHPSCSMLDAVSVSV